MAAITIRNLDEALKSRLRVRAAARDRSMEEEARQIIKAALEQPDSERPVDLGGRIRERFAKFGDVRLQIEPREPVPEPRLTKQSAKQAGKRR